MLKCSKSILTNAWFCYLSTFGLLQEDWQSWHEFQPRLELEMKLMVRLWMSLNKTRNWVRCKKSAARLIVISACLFLWVMQLSAEEMQSRQVFVEVETRADIITVEFRKVVINSACSIQSRNCDYKTGLKKYAGKSTIPLIKTIF